MQKKRRRKKKKRAARFLRFTAFLLAVTLFAAGAGWSIQRSPNNMPNLFISGVNVGGLSAGDTLEALINAKIDSRKLEVSTFGGISRELDAASAGVIMPLWDYVEAANRCGKNGNVFSTLFTYLSLKKEGFDLGASMSGINEEYVLEAAENICREYRALLGEEEFVLDKKNLQLEIVKGYGSEINPQALAVAISEALKAGNTELHYLDVEPQISMPNFESMLEKINFIPIDAKIASDGSYDIIPQVESHRFDVTEAEILWNKAEPAEKIIIPVTVNEPSVTEKDLNEKLYGTLMGRCEISYADASSKQMRNIRKAVSKINGHVILPDTEFSFLDVVGDITEGNGFEMACAYDREQSRRGRNDEIGGGISRVSSALYSCALSSGINVVERSGHRYSVDFAEKGKDAYVGNLLAGGKKDLVLYNQSDFPIKITLYTDSSSENIIAEFRGENTL